MHVGRRLGHLKLCRLHGLAIFIARIPKVQSDQRKPHPGTFSDMLSKTALFGPVRGQLDYDSALEPALYLKFPMLYVP
jgi:hypothetical protein